MWDQLAVSVMVLVQRALTTPMWAGGIMHARYGAIGYANYHYEGLSFTPPIVIGGRLYYNVESLPREGWRVLDLYTAEELWKISMLGVSMPSGNGRSNYAISDGYLLALNGYDNQIYCYGKGPSATTVTVAPKVIAQGTSIIIEGTVTDMCTGAKKLVEDGKFNSVPAMADESQEDWMEYLYMQQQCPDVATGVPVVLYAIDPNGNYQEIGTA